MDKGLRETLRSGGRVVGSWVNSASPIAAELMAAAGFDFLTVDAEHSAVDVPQVQGLFQAIRSGSPSCAALVRLPGHDYATVKRFMDAGAGGVIAPLINTSEQAEEVVAAVKYPPEGSRGVGFARANVYGMRLEAAVAAANTESVVCVQIEHVDGVAAVDEILAVPGVDVAFIGPYDLSASMGITGQFNHRLMRDAEHRILESCRRHGVAPGIHVIQPDPADVRRRTDEGYRMIAYSLDITMLSEASRRGLAEIRRLLGPEPS
ncbi:MAG TPA: aldolase/citrate lyase family protein [bacterium]|jgi:2-dehydro-3-deoxyglucarate aldolase